jgi:hypothetical protein
MGGRLLVRSFHWADSVHAVARLHRSGVKPHDRNTADDRSGKPQNHDVAGEYAVRDAAFGNFWGSGFKPQPTIGNALCFDRSGGVSDHELDLFRERIRGVREFVQQIRAIQETLARWPRCPNYKSLIGAKGRSPISSRPDDCVKVDIVGRCRLS